MNCIRVVGLTGLAAALTAMGACASPQRADVAFSSGDMAVVLASTNEQSKSGVGKLRTESWPEAVEQFELALAKDPKDYKSLFGAAVAYEQMGQRAKALAAYKRLVEEVGAGTEENPQQYLEGFNRVRN